MTPQAIVGLVLIVLGVAVKVAAAAGWLPGDITFIGEVMALGTFLLGKEMAPSSAAALQKRASKYPPVALVLGVLLLGGCAGSLPEPDSVANRVAANELRDAINDASDTLSRAHGALPFVCAHLGPDSAACVALEDTYRVLASAVNAAHRGIDLLDAVGVGAEHTRATVDRVLAEAEVFGAAVERSGEEVRNALERNRQAADAD